MGQISSFNKNFMRHRNMPINPTKSGKNLSIKNFTFSCHNSVRISNDISLEHLGKDRNRPTYSNQYFHLCLPCWNCCSTYVSNVWRPELLCEEFPKISQMTFLNLTYKDFDQIKTLDLIHALIILSQSKLLRSYILLLGSFFLL